ncbi:MAG TPA: protein kinase [Pyrinomonadaceae bacterium]|nr:protein kinase [Pyrinomonadaceae bacterium]
MNSPISEGRKIGKYQVRSQIGVGGMGEVYLADDTQLDRRVALKILPPDLALKRERMARFVREAKAAAALNHPNIAHIYEIGEDDGLNFIAMEFVEGKTLREKIHHEKADLRKLLKYLQQVASGLAKAHSAGIVHRDLKPDNIMVAKDGYAKILDFGLAKLIEPAGLGSETAASDIATVEYEQHSLPGKLLGTIGYMSPEQAQGKVDEIDHRSDIFSFGCMLYEAITLQRPFQGESKVQSLYRIVYEPAPALRDLNPNAPLDLQRIVRRCLAKDPDERYQSIQDVAIELKELRRDLEGDTNLDVTIPPTYIGSEVGQRSSMRSSVSPTVGDHTATSTEFEARPTSSASVIIGEIKQHKRGFVLVVIGLVVIAGALVAAWRKFSGSGPAEPFNSMRIARLTTGGKVGNASIKGYASISPDGKFVVFRTTELGKDSLWVKQVPTGSVVKIVPDLPGKVGGTTFSRDGSLIFFSMFENDPRGTLYQVPVLGGTPQRIMAGVTSAVTFSPDGKQIAFVRTEPEESKLMIANTDGTGERTIATRKLPEHFPPSGGPSWSPDGKTIACGAETFRGNVHATVVEVPATGGAEKAVTTHNWVSVSRVLWLNDGSGLIIAAVPELISAGTQLWHLSYPGGEVRRITNDLNAYGTTSLGLTADSKTIVTIQADRAMQIWVAKYGETPAEPKQITYGKYDGDTLAWTVNKNLLYTAPSGEQLDVWNVDPASNASRQVTNDAYIEKLGCVSNDGRFAVFSSNRSGNFNLWKLSFSAGDQQQLTQGNEVDSHAICSPDGQWVVFRSFREGKSTFWKIALAGGDPQQLFNKTSSSAAISPDGKLVAIRYVDDRTNSNQIAVLPFEGGDPIATLPVSINYRDVGLGWTADSKSIIYADARDNADNIWSVPLQGGPAKQLTKFTNGLIFAFQVSADGKDIAISRGTQTDDVILIRDPD